jgi:cytochrome P450 family 4
MFFSHLIDNVIIPNGCAILLQIYIMQRDEKNFKNALQFIPERFEEERNKVNHFDYVPFSAGPRNCIGWMILLRTIKKRILLNLFVYFQDKNLPCSR